jgi:GntP family gluconate:H+ symporter
MTVIAPLVFLLLTIAFIIVATTRWRLPPFLALLLGACGYGIACGLSPTETLNTITGGLGRTVAGIGIVIAGGCIIGTVLEYTGAAMVMASVVLKLVGRTRTVLAMGITGGVVSVPVFCDSGYVVLSSLVRTLARRTKQSVAALAIALSMGLYATHCLVPPTPGPAAAAEALNADLGQIIALGTLVAMIVVGVCCAFAMWAGRRWYIEPPAAQVNPDEDAVELSAASITRAFAPIVLPVALIATRSFFPAQSGSAWATTVAWLGDPNVALLLGALLALVLARRHGMAELGEWSGEALRSAGGIVLVTGAGGALGAVLRATPLADAIGAQLASLDLGLFNILLPFLIAAGLKTAQGSSTVAIVTTASLLAPLLVALGLDQGTALSLTVLAIGAGAMTVSHVNDSYFWVVTQLSGLSVSQGYRVVTLGSGIAGLTGISVILAIRLLVG